MPEIAMNSQKETFFGPWETLVLWGMVVLAVLRWSATAEQTAQASPRSDTPIVMAR